MQAVSVNNIHDLLKKYEPLLNQSNALIQETLSSTAPQVSDLAHSLKHSRGKQLRPLLTYTLLQDSHQQAALAAACFESVHAASLIHDDMIDKCEVRRNLPTMNHLHNDSVAVLLGDLLFTSVFTLAAQMNQAWFTIQVSATIKELIEGELLQQAHKRNTQVSLDQYYEIIRKKTAALLHLCASASARLAQWNENEINAIGEFATCFGMIFQVADDWADFTKAGQKDNKDRGADIANGFITLPWIKLLKYSSNPQREIVKEVIESGQRCGLNHPQINAISKELNLDKLVGEEIQKLAVKARHQLTLLPESAPKDELSIYLEAALKTFST